MYYKVFHNLQCRDVQVWANKHQLVLSILLIVKVFIGSKCMAKIMPNFLPICRWELISDEQIVLYLIVEDS